MNEVDRYISTFPPEVQKILQKVRETILKEVPDAKESIGYGIPTYKLNGKNLVHFGGFKNHIGFYPAPSGIEAFKEDFSSYKGAKGSVQFPLNKPMPFDLITRLVKFRLNEELAKKG